jgi:hypothetical protein
MKENRIVSVTDFQANQAKTLETALFFAQVVEEKMKDPDDKRVFLGREEEGITIFPADQDLIKIARGVAKGATLELIFELKGDEWGNSYRVKNDAMAEVVKDITNRVNGDKTA